MREHLSKSNSSGYYKINHVNKSPCSSGRRTTDSRDPNVGPISSNTSKSWEASIGSADLGKSASYSSNANDSNQIPSDWHNYSISNNLNRDDTSPLGGPSTSEDINIAISSIEGKGNSDESEFVKHRIEQLNSQSNSQLQQLSSRISGRSTSNTTTSGSFSLAEDSITRSISKEHYKKNQAIPQFIEKKSLKQGIVLSIYFSRQLEIQFKLICEQYVFVLSLNTYIYLFAERVRVSSPSQIHASQPIGDEVKRFVILMQRSKCLSIIWNFSFVPFLSPTFVL